MSHRLNWFSNQKALELELFFLKHYLFRSFTKISFSDFLVDFIKKQNIQVLITYLKLNFIKHDSKSTRSKRFWNQMLNSFLVCLRISSFLNDSNTTYFILVGFLKFSGFFKNFEFENSNLEFLRWFRIWITKYSKN